MKNDFLKIYQNFSNMKTNKTDKNFRNLRKLFSRYDLNNNVKFNIYP